MQFILALVLAVVGCNAFHHPSSQFRSFRLHASKLTMTNPEVKSLGSIARLQSMAAQLRAGLSTPSSFPTAAIASYLDSPIDLLMNTEASSMEHELQQARVKQLSIAFESFDTNKDGSISLEELKEGLEKAFKDLVITKEQAEKLMITFDKSKDGAIQFDEFQGAEAFKNRLDAFLRDEKEAEIAALFKARENKMAAEAAVEKSQALADFQSSFNEGKPSTSDKIVSLLPYFFPLLDSIQYGKYLLNTETDNPLIIALVLLYQLYLSVPFSGLICFFALGALSNNIGLNRLIRFNIQQAISLDIALIVPSLLGGIGVVGLPYLGMPVPEEVQVLFSTGTFFAFSAAILYSCVSSLLGVIPNKLPLISERVENRVPSSNMFDENGKLLTKDDKDKNKDEDNQN